jgi:hypothetical protein
MHLFGKLAAAGPKFNGCKNIVQPDNVKRATTFSGAP